MHFELRASTGHLRYSDVGWRQQALALSETVLAARKETLGEEHPETLRSMQDLAILKAKEETAVQTQSSFRVP